MERVEKPWGYEIIWAKTDKYAGKILHINSGHKLSLQYHEKKMETIYILNGKLRLDYKIGDDLYSKTLSPGESYHVNPGDIHRFICDDDQEFVELVEVSTSELNDVIRLQDFYGRL